MLSYSRPAFGIAVSLVRASYCPLIHMFEARTDPVVVKEAQKGDRLAVRAIIEAATRELRQIYRLRGQRPRYRVPASILVALDRNTIVGTAEYVIKNDHVYVQGVAVRSSCRRKGICRSLLAAAGELARKSNLRAVKLHVIEETGNVVIFEKLGFKVANRAVATDYVGASGGIVTRVEMERQLA